MVVQQALYLQISMASSPEQALLGYTDHDKAQRLLELPKVVFVSKPFDTPTMAQAMESLR